MRNISEMVQVLEEDVQAAYDTRSSGSLTYVHEPAFKLDSLDQPFIVIDGEQHLDVLEALLVLSVNDIARTSGPWTREEIVEYLDRPQALEDALVELENDKSILNYSAGKNGRVFMESETPRNLIQIYALCVRVRQVATEANNAMGLCELVNFWNEG